MSGYDYSDIFDGDGHGEQTGSGLRKQLEEALAEIKSLRKDLTEEKRGSTVKGLFEEKGIDPAAAGLVPADADPKVWLEQNAQFLKAASVVPPVTDPPAVPKVEAAPDPALVEERKALEGLQGATDTGIPSLATADQLTKLKSFDNPEDLMAFIQSGGTAT